MESINKFLGTTVFTFGETSITAGQLLAVPVALIFGWIVTLWVARIVGARMAAKGANPNAIQLAQRLIIAVALVVLVFLALDFLNIPLGAFAFISGAIAIGVGFGAQNIINNFISGWILMWERPIRIGDFLEVGQALGTVEAINTRSTRIKRIDGVHMLVPNSHLLENIVINWTLRDNVVRSIVRVGVVYGTDLDKVSELIEQALRDVESILGRPEPRIIFEDFGDNSLVFDIYFWAETGNNARRELKQTRSDLRFKIYELFQKNEIVIAFPQQDVHIDGALTINQKADSASLG